MCTETIQFTILNTNNELVTITANLREDKRLYRCGKPIYCSCNQNKPAPYLYLDGSVYCPSCGKKSLSVTTFEDTLNTLHLTFMGKDNNTMQDLYRLSDTVPYSTWNRIAEYFVKLNPTDVDFGYNISYVGWVTSNPEAVEEVLDIKDSLRVCNQKITTNHNTPVNSKVDGLSEEEKFDIVDKLHEVFSVVETPYGEFQLFTAKPGPEYGYSVVNPLYPPNPVIGNGEFWFIKEAEDEIWYVRYNYMDGADRRMNNVLIDFELKAIGKMISYDKDVAELILRLEK